MYLDEGGCELLFLQDSVIIYSADLGWETSIRNSSSSFVNKHYSLGPSTLFLVARSYPCSKDNWNNGLTTESAREYW